MLQNATGYLSKVIDRAGGYDASMHFLKTVETTIVRLGYYHCYKIKVLLSLLRLHVTVLLILMHFEALRTWSKGFVTSAIPEDATSHYYVAFKLQDRK